MKRSRFSEEQIIAILKEQEAGSSKREFALKVWNDNQFWLGPRALLTGILGLIPLIFG